MPSPFLAKNCSQGGRKNWAQLRSDRKDAQRKKYQELLGVILEVIRDFCSFSVLSAFRCLMVGAQVNAIFFSAFWRFLLVAASSVVFTAQFLQQNRHAPILAKFSKLYCYIFFYQHSFSKEQCQLKTKIVEFKSW